MALAVAEILEEWRRAERILAALPLSAPERPVLETDVRVLKATYQRLTTSTIPRTQARIEASRRHVETIRSRLAEIQAKYDRLAGLGPDRPATAEVEPADSAGVDHQDLAPSEGPA